MRNITDATGNVFMRELENLIEGIVRKVMAGLHIEGEEKLMSTEEASIFIGLSKATIYSKACRREIPFHKIPGSKKLRFDRNELIAWQKSKQRNKK